MDGLWDGETSPEDLSVDDVLRTILIEEAYEGQGLLQEPEG